MNNECKSKCEYFEKLSRWLKVILYSSKLIWGILAGIPTLLALIELIVFGIDKNSFLLKPILSPHAICKTDQSKTFSEGDGKNFLINVELEAPLYVKWFSIKNSMEYSLSLDAIDGYTFYETDFPKESFRGRVRHFYESDKTIVKKVQTLHKFRSRTNVKFIARMSGPYEPVEDQCPFDVSVSY